MTESESRVNQGRLTNQSNHPRLELGRDFMAEGSVPTETAERPSVEATVGHLRRASERREARERGLSPAELIYKAATDAELEKSDILGEEARRLNEIRTSVGRVSKEDLIIDDIERIKDREERIKEILKHLKEISPDQQQDPNLLSLIAGYDETVNYFVNKIVSPPLDAETSSYELSFYARINLEAIKGMLRANSGSGHLEEKRYHRVLGIIEATHIFHGMNKEIVTGNLEGFVGAARAVTPEQLQVLQNVPGVAQVMRLFDEEYNRLVARDDYIKNRGAYDIMMGIKRDESGAVKGFTGGSIEDQLRKLVENDKALGLGGNLEKLEDWQIRWAFQAGKLLTNLSLRAAELISIGKPNTGSDDESYASFAQEPAAGLMNWVRKAKRFEISEVRGGVKLLDMARKFFQRDREKQGYGKIKIAKIAGKDIDDFEDAGMFGASGIWSSWRQNVILLKNAKMHIEGFKSKTLGELIEEKEIEWEEGRKKAGDSPEKIAKEKKARKAQYLGETYLDGSGNLRKEFNSYLGVLLKHGSLKGELLDKPDVIAIKQKIREEIWKRAAKDNPLGVVPFLIGVEFPKDEHGQQIIPKGFEGLDLNNLTDVLKAEGGVWDSLRGKLRIAHERRLTAIREGEADVTLDKFILENGKQVEGLALTGEEQKLLGQIRNSGKLLAGEFAKIRLPFNPFMNDVLFEDADYGDAGSTFFTRREGSDLPSIYKSYEEFTKIMNNPGIHSVEELAAILKEMVQGMAVPQSTETGQDRVAPFTEAILTFISAGSHIEKPARLKLFGREIPLPMPVGLLRWVSKSEVANNISNSTNHPNSLMQQLAGVDALAVNEEGMVKVLNIFLKAGVLRRGFIKDGILAATDLYNEMKKKLKAGPGWLLAAFFRIFIPASALGAVVETGKRTYQGK